MITLLTSLQHCLPFLDWWPTQCMFWPFPAERYLVAANMHNNEEVLPHFILQLIHLFAVLPPETAFLSIYESGSTDSTGEVTPSTALPHLQCVSAPCAWCSSLEAACCCLSACAASLRFCNM